jgi:uncharacterized RDD family membrane protein YckC
MDESPKEENSLFPEADIKFASFGKRFGAALLDGLILVGIFLPITYFNVMTLKIPYIFIVTALVEIIYKPFMEYRFGATLGKMALGIEVVGPKFQRVSFNEEMKRVSFYIVPNFLQFILSVRVYFTSAFLSFKTFDEYNQFIVNTNPSTALLRNLVIFIGVADCITFFTNTQGRSLHDLYGGTYVIEKIRG